MTIPLSGPDVPPVVRTDDARFENLPGYPFEPHYVQVRNPHGEGTLRMHYVDEGPKDGAVVLMVHGEPAWSYIYRKMIPIFADAGLRAIAVDHIGFGRSDKLTRPAHYTFESHITWLRELVMTLDLREIDLVCQDWGGPIAPDVAAAFDAPFPSEWHKAGMRQFPLLIPVTRTDPGATINLETWKILAEFDRSFLTLFGDSDPGTRGWAEIFRERVPGAKGQPHRTLERAGHFWQEDCGEEAAAIIIDWIRSGDRREDRANESNPCG